MAGITGHDPWKQDETYSFGIIYNFYQAHTWLVPTNVDLPFVEKPPLYYWTAAILCRMLAGKLPLHDAARLASFFYMMIACLSLWAAAWLLFENEKRSRELRVWALSLMLGSLGLVRHSHDMFTDNALVAGTCIAISGLAMLSCRPHRFIVGGLLLGLGTGVSFLSKGFLMPMVLGMAAIALLWLRPSLRTRHAGLCLLWAMLAAAPFLFIWPCLLYRYSPGLFMEWFWNNNIGRFLGFSVDLLGAPNRHGYMCYTILWFAFPAFPLACAALVKNRLLWREPACLVPLALFVPGFALLSLSASARALYLLPLIPPLALLGAQAIPEIPEQAFRVWNFLVRLVASIAAAGLVCIWVCLLHPSGPQPLAKFYGGWLHTGFMPQHSQLRGCILAGAFVLIWLLSFRLKARDAAVIWLCAVGLQWGIANALLLPWADETRSFRPVIENLSRFISRPRYANDCIARFHLGESVAPMLHYFGKGRESGPLENFSGKTCPLLLILTGKTSAVLPNPDWHIVWEGSRRFDDKDILQLWERNNR